jgi:hypothetical protein
MEPEVKIKRFSRSKRPVKEAEEAVADFAEEKVPEVEDIEAPPPQIEEEDDGFLDDLKVGMGMPDIVLPPPPSPVKRSVAKGGRKKKAATFADSGDFMGEFGDFFSEKATPILGADKRVLLAKVRQYKALFHDIPEIKSFKIKPTANEAELENAIAEMDVIVSVGTVQELTDQMILSAIRVVETVSSRTNRYDVTGTADMLAVNPEFKKLARLLAIKYKVYSQVPPEWQMMLLVMSTAMVCRSTNIKKAEINGLLDQPM